jgi:endonuclease-3
MTFPGNEKKEVEMTENKRIMAILERIGEHYFDKTKCYLDHENAWQLLIATILSAQCTDERVNMVTKTLFSQYTSVYAFASADIHELEQAIHSTGFYRNKAKNIINCCIKLIEEYNGEVPHDIDQLTKLAGVGRKTANVIRGNIYHEPSIVVDTHVKRISRKLGFTENEDPVKIEFDLMKILPRDRWISYNTQIIAHGRAICTARSPKCENCFLLPYCPWGLEKCLEDIESTE